MPPEWISWTISGQRLNKVEQRQPRRPSQPRDRCCTAIVSRRLQSGRSRLSRKVYANRHAQLKVLAHRDRLSRSSDDHGLAVVAVSWVPGAACRQGVLDRPENAVCSNPSQLGSHGQRGEKRTYECGRDLALPASMGRPAGPGRKGPDPANFRPFRIMRERSKCSKVTVHTLQYALTLSATTGLTHTASERRTLCRINCRSHRARALC